MSLATQYAITVNGKLVSPQQHSMSMLLFGWMQADPKPEVFDTLGDAQHAAAQLSASLATQYGLTPIVQVVHRYCTDWMGGDPAEGLAAAVERYLNDGGDAA